MVQHSEQKKTEELNKVRKVIAGGEFTEDNISCMTECSIILGNMPIPERLILPRWCNPAMVAQCAC